MSRKRENTGFTCANCGKEVLPLTNGSYRNHCPFCLYSLHVDSMPGDRMSECMGQMKPVDLVYHTKKGWQVVHRCIRCGSERANTIAEKTTQPDDFSYLIKILKKERGDI